MKKAISILMTIITVITATNCGGETDPDMDARDTETVSCEGMEVYHNIEYSTENTYVSEDGNVFNVWVDYEKKTDFDLVGDISYSGKDIGMIAHWVAQVYEEKGYSNAALVKEKLQNIQVIITHTKEEMARLNNPALYETNPEQAIKDIDGVNAFIESEMPECMANMTPEANFYFVMKVDRTRPQNITTVIHELMHPTSFYGWGDVDAEHDDPRLWMWLSDDSIQAKVYDIWWDYTYGDDGSSVWEQN